MYQQIGNEKTKMNTSDESLNKPAFWNVSTERTWLIVWTAGFQQTAGKIWRTVLVKTCPGIGRVLVSEGRK